MTGWNHDFERIFDFQNLDFSDFNMLVRFKKYYITWKFRPTLKKKIQEEKLFRQNFILHRLRGEKIRIPPERRLPAQWSFKGV